MPRRTSFLSILLVLAMTAAALTPWAAAASGGLALVTSGQEATSQTVGFTGVPQDCQSLQVTLTLSQSGPSYDFALDGSLAALPGAYFLWLAAIILGYMSLATAMKQSYIRRFGQWL